MKCRGSALFSQKQIHIHVLFLIGNLLSFTVCALLLLKEENHSQGGVVLINSLQTVKGCYCIGSDGRGSSSCAGNHALVIWLHLPNQHLLVLFWSETSLILCMQACRSPAQVRTACGLQISTCSTVATAPTYVLHLFFKNKIMINTKNQSPSMNLVEENQVWREWGAQTWGVFCTSLCVR